MKYLYSWLKEFYPGMPSIRELPDLLIQIGHDVESVAPVTFDDVIVAEILNVTKHPDADKLSLVTITDGTTEHEVVCGAPNVQVGQKVAYAPVETLLPSGMLIRQAKVRGILSDGMLCAEDELSLGSAHAGLLELPDEAVTGQPLASYVTEDAVFSLDITPNRGDVLSHFGLARDIYAIKESQLLTAKFKTPNYEGNTSSFAAIDTIHADVTAFNLGLVAAEAVPATPLFMQSRLNLLGVKSINLPTDITNYLMLAYGQPMHAYDANALGEDIAFGVRRAHSGEQFTGLNNQIFTLDLEALVITNRDQSVGLAGILGGENSKVQNDSKRILFESASFHPKAISLAARRLNLLTESALRFERGVDPELRASVLGHAQALWQELTGGQAYAPLKKSNPAMAHPVQNDIDIDRLQQFVSLPIGLDQTESIFTSLGIIIDVKTDASLRVTPPSWRFDLTFPEDYYEEIVRIIGTQNIPKRPLPATVPVWKRSAYWRNEYLKDILVSVGAHEIKTYPFVAKSELPVGPTAPIELTMAPISDKPFLRQSLLPGTLAAVAANPEVPFMVLFEVARVYLPDKEIDHLIILTASNNQAEVDDWWQNFFERLRLPVSSWMSRLQIIDEPTRLQYKIRKSSIRVLELPIEEMNTTKQYEILPVAIPDLDAINYTPLSKFQASRRDIAFLVDASYTSDTIANELRELHPYIVDVELFDTFRDPRLGDDKQSLAFHILYQAPNKTLTTEEINELHKMGESFIKERYHGKIR